MTNSIPLSLPASITVLQNQVHALTTEHQQLKEQLEEYQQLLHAKISKYQKWKRIRGKMEHEFEKIEVAQSIHDRIREMTELCKD